MLLIHRVKIILLSKCDCVKDDILNLVLKIIVGSQALFDDISEIVWLI